MLVGVKVGLVTIGCLVVLGCRRSLFWVVMGWLGLIRFGFFFFQAEDGIRDVAVTGVQTCALPISDAPGRGGAGGPSGDHGGTGLSPPGPGVAEVVGRGDRGSLRDRARRDPDRARRAHARSRPRARAADPARAAHRARAISRGSDVSDRGKPLYMIGVVAQMLNVHPQTLRF